MTDLTRITTPLGLLDADTADALRAYRGPVQVFMEGRWRTVATPRFQSALTYRAKRQEVNA